MKIIINKISAFVKKETVFSIAALLAIISSFLVHPSKEYIGYIDYRVLAILFCLMFIVAGLKEQWIFRRLAEKLTKLVGSSKGLELILVLLCFFSSMIITNDVALITFVPFALALMKGAGLSHRIIRVVTLETIAANLGSMLTPIGNPQNLYLYNLSNMSFMDFIVLLLPLTLISLLLLIVAVLVGKKESLTISFEEASHPINKVKLSILTVLFLICMGTIARFVPWQISFIIVLAVSIILFRNLLKEIDYFLLGTFIAFFVFIGNMQNIESISRLINNLVNNRELFVSVALSQVISNVPASMLLSGFTKNYTPLLYGVNIGGLGTLIASLASLISYKFYAVTENSKKGKYLLTFTFWNLLFLVILLPIAYVLLTR